MQRKIGRNVITLWERSKKVPGRVRMELECGCAGNIILASFEVPSGNAGTECGHIEDMSFDELREWLGSIAHDYFLAWGNDGDYWYNELEGIAPCN